MAVATALRLLRRRLARGSGLLLLGGREDLLWWFAALLLGVALFRFGIGVLQSWIYAGLTARILLDMRTDFLAHLQRLPPRTR